MKKTKRSLFGILLVAQIALIPTVVLADHSSVSNTHSDTDTSYTLSATSSCTYDKNLAVGMRGSAVKCLQDSLVMHGFLPATAATGYFGTLTKRAVIAWQKMNAIPATGFIGTISRNVLSEKNNSLVQTSSQLPHHVPSEDINRSKSDTALHSSTTNMLANQAAHSHTAMDVSLWTSIPTVALTAHPDAMGGWNLEVVTTNFRFAPEHANSAPVDGEGHMHLFVDGVKLTRLYGPWYYLSAKSVGSKGTTHVIGVSLNANDHSDFVLNGKVVSATTTVSVQ